MIELAPSLLAADLLHLHGEIGKMLENGVTRLHFDVMDAHFVPNLSFGPGLLKAVRQAFPACRLDVHLMMDEPEKYISVFADAGADILTLHREVLPDAEKALRAIKALGVKCGLSIKPETGEETLFPYLDQIENLLVMTVEPGFGGQKFMPDELEKIRRLRRAGYRGDIAVDGGVNLENAPEIVKAGANVLVMGTAYFRAEDPAGVARAVREMA